MRPAGTRGEGETDPGTAATTAHTTSIHPTLNANMQPRAATAERTSEPGAQDEAYRDQPLTKAIIEPHGTLSLQGDRNGEPVGVRECLLEQSFIAYVERYAL